MKNNNYTIFEDIKTLEEEKIGDSLGLRIIKTDQGHWQLALMIYPKTTITDIRNSWKKIRAARQLLATIQTPAVFDDAEMVREFFFEKKDDKEFSYRKISETINSMLHSILKDFSLAGKNNDFTAMSELMPEFDNLLKVFGISELDATSYMIQGLGDLWQEVVPWKTSTGPVSKEHVRAAYRKWIRNKESIPVIPSWDEIINELKESGRDLKNTLKY